MDQSPTKSSDSKYKLSHAKTSKKDSTQDTRTSGATSQAQTPTTYRLDNAKNSALAQDLGKQVEIVAMIEPDASTPTATSGSNSAGADEPKLMAEASE
jgi:hypothetical protein